MYRFTDLYEFLNDDAHAEADIFTVFKKIMELGQKDMFNPSPMGIKNLQSSLNVNLPYTPNE